MNERNVCIGDIISVGPEALLQVSLPRSPCFKLNHRFSIKKFAPITANTSRTGWYYRVLQEGLVTPGDHIKLVERKWPTWTIARIQEYLVRDKNNHAMNEELAGIEELGEECRGQFRSRVAKAKKKSEPRTEEVWTDLKLIKRTVETPRITSFEFECIGDHPDQGASIIGAHAKLRLPNGLVRSYSVVSDDDNEEFVFKNKIKLGVARAEDSRGGSRYLHDEAKLGDVIQIGRVTTDAKMAGAASNHVFIIGGIGITAFLRMMEAYRSIHWGMQIHYAVRSSDDIPFRDRLRVLENEITYYDKSKGGAMNVAEIIKNRPWNSQIYVCGPGRLMVAAKTAASEAAVSADEIHFEAFSADISGDPFEAEVIQSDGNSKVLQVGADESLLEVLRTEYKDVASSCEVGNCGTCKITLKSGRVEHRGTALLPEEEGSSLLSCVSRGIGRIVIEI